MKTLKHDMESMKSEYQAKITEFNERSNQHDASSSMLKSLKEKHEKEIELLKEVLYHLIRSRFNRKSCA